MGPCEVACGQLLQLMVQGAPAGVNLPHPWKEFAGEMRAPDHAAQRVPSNLERYAGNYINLLFGSAVCAALISRPILVTVCSAVEAVALLAPPEMFDVEVKQRKSHGGGFRSVGGAWLRF